MSLLDELPLTDDQHDAIQRVAAALQRVDHEPFLDAVAYRHKVSAFMRLCYRRCRTARGHDQWHTELAGTTTKRPAAPLVRDEDAAGSNPATPTKETAGQARVADERRLSHPARVCAPHRPADQRAAELLAEQVRGVQGGQGRWLG